MGMTQENKRSPKKITLKKETSKSVPFSKGIDTGTITVNLEALDQN